MGDKPFNNESARVQRSTTRDTQTEVARRGDPKKERAVPFPSGLRSESFARDTFPPSSRLSTRFGLTETSD